MTPENCYCGSQKHFTVCCEPYIIGTQKAPTAEALMRSRYSAYVVQAVNYLLVTTHISKREHHSKVAMLQWAKNNLWHRLEIMEVTKSTVEFKAYYSEKDNVNCVEMHHEKSSFALHEGTWFYVDGLFF